PSLPLGTTVEVEFAIDVKHSIEVRVRVSQDEGRERCESATIEPAPPARRPTRAEGDEVQKRFDELLREFRGGYRAGARPRAEQLRQALREALSYDDEPKAIQRMAELRDLLHQMEAHRGLVLDPPWTRFAQLVRQCLDVAAEVAAKTGRDREELFEHIQAQE